MNNAKTSEKGQALVEMCAGIIGMLSVFVAILFVSGICISNIKTLKSSKVNAETSVLNSTDSYLIERRDIYAWNYGDNNIPFTAADQPLYNTINRDGLVDEYLSASIYSAENGYEFKPLNEIDMRVNRTPETNFFTSFFDNYATAASLVYGMPDSYDKLYSYRTQPAAEREALQRAIATWLGVDVGRLNLAMQRTNQAYMPNFGRYIPQTLPVPDRDEN
jgi:hypothetical protein